MSKPRAGRSDANDARYEREILGAILIVEPNEYDRNRFAEILTEARCRALVAADGREASDLLQREAIDLAIVDVDLADITCYDLLGYVKTLFEDAVPVLLTANSDHAPDELATALDRGIDSYLVKPVTEHVLTSTVRTLLRTSAAEREKRALLGEIRKYGQRLQTMVESVPGIVWESNGPSSIRDHELVFVSKYFEHDLGYSASDWQGRAGVWSELIHPEDQSNAFRVMQRVMESRLSAVCEFRIFAKDGRIVPLESYLSGIFDDDGHATGVRGMSMDVSERYRSEYELRRAKEAAEAASRSKDQFIAVLSHELRTPLTPVLTTIEMLESDPALAPELKPLVEILRRNVELEARLIDDLLDLTRISKGKIALNLKAVNAHDIIGNVLGICNKEATQRELEIRVSLFARRYHVMADPARLQQILWNLVHNAIKFTPSRGAITIRTRSKSDERGNDAGSLIIEVTDTGIGIEPEILPHIFAPFEQGDVLITKQFGGLGLGLAITRDLVTLHGGTITARSRGRNLGATFLIELPVIPSETEATPPMPLVPDVPAQASSAKRIMLVDDHMDTGRVVQLLLERRGFHVERALTMSNALSLAERYEFDLLVSDIGLPDGNGYELLQAIRERKGEVLAIALSGFGTNDDISRSYQSGFRAHITKPFNFPELHAKIEELLKLQEKA